MNKICIRQLLLFILVPLALGAEQAPDTGVIQELERFQNSWATPIPHDDPRFGIIRVLSLLNLEFPGLETVKAASLMGKYEVAEHELLAFYKKRFEMPEGPVRPLREGDLLHADNALRHYFRGNQDVHPPVFRGPKIDWTGRAFVEGREIHDREWYLQFQRLTWWPDLARAYAGTSDEKYFREWRYELVQWAEEFLPFTRQTPSFVARGMETYGRCEVHHRVLPQMIRSEEFDAKTLLYYLVSFHEQAEHIRKVYSADGNHRLGELRQVFVNGISHPEFIRAEEWKNDALTLLPKMMTDAIYDDGMNKELIFSYHSMYMGLFADAYRLFRKHGYDKFLPPDYYPRLLKMADIYAMQIFPDFTICQFGDAWKGSNAGSVFRGVMSDFSADLPYYQYMTSSGREGVPPSRCNAAYPESGFYFFRSAWKPDAVFMPLKCGPIGEWHNQIDNGTFELFAYGRNLMTDSGCYIYGSSLPEDQRWREWFRSSKAHQTLTMDKQDIELKPTHRLWSESDNLVALVVENQSYPELKHRRTILFIDNQWFLIHDEAIGNASGDIRVHFQFVPCDFQNDGNGMLTKFSEGANLRVQTFPINDKPIHEVEEGWIAYTIGKKERRPAWSWKVRKSKDQPKVEFLTALIPFRQGESPSPSNASVTAEGESRLFTWKDKQETRKIRLDLASGKAQFVP